MNRSKSILVFIGFAVIAADPFLTGCERNDMSGTKTIYGTDDRVEAVSAELTYPQSTALARATFILVDEHELNAAAVVDGDDHRDTLNLTYHLRGPTYGATYRLCSDERFYDQPTNGFCTGVLVGRNKILTASHCIRSQKKCARTRMIADYQQQKDGTIKTEFFAGDIFSCKALAYRSDDPRRKQDLLIVDLDRPVFDRDPVEIERAEEALDRQAGLMLAGYPRGLPKKVVTDGRLLRLDPWSAGTNLDSFVGNSGSPVLSRRSGKVLGIMIRGSSDFVADGACFREKLCRLNECVGETLSVVKSISDEIPSVDPQLRVTSASAKEVSGNGNGVIEPGDTFEFSLTLVNTGSRSIESADWRIVSEHPAARWEGAHGHIDHLAWNEKTNHIARLSIDHGDRCSSPYRFRLQTLTSSTRTDTPFTVFPGKRSEIRHHILAAPVNLDPSGTFTASINLPVIDELTEVFPFIDISHPRPDLLAIAVAPRTGEQGSPLYWYQQQLPEGSPSPDTNVKKRKGHFGIDFQPYHDVNQANRPIPAGQWHLRVNDGSRHPMARINQLGFTVAKRTCE